MRKRSNEEKQFIESIDRLLSGEEVEGFEDMSEDYQTAINFARKLAELRAEPSPEFRDQLKQRLLLQLTRQEVETAREKERGISFWEFLKNLVPQSPAWRTATVTIAVVLVTVGVLWRTGMFTQAPVLETTVLEAPATESLERGVAPKVGATPPAPVVERAIQPLLQLEAAQLEPVFYPLGQTVEIELVFRNVSSESITVSPFPPSIHIVGRSTIRPARSFAQGTGELVLPPSESQSYTLVWDQQDSSEKQVMPGWYTVYVGEVTITKDTEPRETSLSLPPAIKLLIQFPQGAIEKAIELNQSQTVNDITITLERVELSASEVKFYAFNVPPDYSLPQGSDRPSPSLMALHAYAEYILDNGPKIDAGTSGIRFLDNGMRHIWSMLDPVPKDAGELTFIITGLGEWEGPWVFTISLQD